MKKQWNNNCIYSVINCTICHIRKIESDVMLTSCHLFYFELGLHTVVITTLEQNYCFNSYYNDTSILKHYDIGKVKQGNFSRKNDAL